MNRNTELHFSNVPNIGIARSKFNRNSDHKTSLNTGDLVPIYLTDILPGDTAKIKTNMLIRMTTPINPVMDNCFADLYYFFVPNRLIWTHWKAMMGENDSTYWTQPTEYTVPQTEAPQGGWQKGSIADYFGIPIGVDGISVSSLPFRALALIYNEWFRDENLIEPLNITMGDATTAGSNGTDPTVDVQKGGMPPKVAKYADYFTTALPEPQKGPDVYLPLAGNVPVITGDTREEIAPPLTWNKTDGTAIPTPSTNYTIGLKKTNMGTMLNGALTSVSEMEITPNNLYADLSETGAATINQLRQAFAVQRLYEKDARGGTRYTEMIRSHFNVTSPDARQQRPEYLGGKRIPINMTQVIQQSSTDATSPQGNTAAYSLTIDSDESFTYSSTEHGWILGLACIRTEHTYQQGIERMWSRKTRLDHYWPTLANIGEQYIKEKEIYAQGTDDDDDAFGYQEAWAEYRYKPSRISGELRSTYATPLDSWHYGDYYTQAPVLGQEWVEETRVNVDRTLAIQNQDQFIADFYFEETMVRPMPMYSVPGLIDHH